MPAPFRRSATVFPASPSAVPPTANVFDHVSLPSNATNRPHDTMLPRTSKSAARRSTAWREHRKKLTNRLCLSQRARLDDGEPSFCIQIRAGELAEVSFRGRCTRLAAGFAPSLSLVWSRPSRRTRTRSAVRRRRSPRPTTTPSAPGAGSEDSRSSGATRASATACSAARAGRSRTRTRPTPSRPRSPGGPARPVRPTAPAARGRASTYAISGRPSVETSSTSRASRTRT